MNALQDMLVDIPGFRPTSEELATYPVFWITGSYTFYFEVSYCFYLNCVIWWQSYWDKAEIFASQYKNIFHNDVLSHFYFFFVYLVWHFLECLESCSAMTSEKMSGELKLNKYKCYLSRSLFVRQSNKNIIDYNLQLQIFVYIIIKSDYHYKIVEAT